MERTDRMLYISESPADRSFDSKMTSYNQQSTITEVHVIGSDTNNVPVNRVWGPPTETATAEIRHVNVNMDANHNVKPSEFLQRTNHSSLSSTSSLPPQTSMKSYSSVSSSASLPHTTTQLRRNQSESAAAEMRPEVGRERATAQMRGAGMENMTAQMWGTESMHAEYRDTGHATVSTEVKHRENGQKKVTISENGQCTCCPYGYHIDLDFVNYCDSLNDPAYLKKLKRLQREKRKLRKSMEVYLQQQENPDSQQTETVEKISLVPLNQQSAPANQVLDEIDSSVDATLASINTMMYTSAHGRLMSSESEGTSSSSSPQNTEKFNTFPRNRGRNMQEEINQFNTSFEMQRGRTDSQSSLSSISTIASERNFPTQSVSTYNHTGANNSYGQSTVTTETSYSRFTHITSEQLAATMATHLPTPEDGAASSQSTTTSISKSSLHEVREVMAMSLQRMRELEEQLKAIPVLQVRISVLKEEKRLLMLQQKARESKMNMRSIGVGGCPVEEVIKPCCVPTVKTPPPVMPKPRLKSKAVGDNNVMVPYLVQPELPPSYTVRDNETFIQETYVLERERGNTALYSPFSRAPKPLTRTIGIGDANVLDDGLKIHEKELRTVIIGEAKSVGKRHVGVDCRVSTRDVGVSIAIDEEKPSTRTVGVNVDTGSLLTSLSFKADEMRSALREVLHKNVRSIGVNCDYRAQTMERGVQFSEYSLRTVGVGDYDVDIELRAPVPTRTVGVEAQPHVINKAVNTDYGWKLDASTNTMKHYQESRSTMTDRARLGSAATMTEADKMYSGGTQTDVMMFMRMDQLKNAGCNTKRKTTYSDSVQTDLSEVVSEDYELEVVSKSRRPIKANSWTNTDAEPRKYSTSMNTEEPRKYSKSINTDAVRTRDMGCSDDKVDSFVCSFNDEERMEETTEEIVTWTTEQEVQSDWTGQTRGQTIERHWDASLDDSKMKTSKETVEVPESSLVVVSQKATNLMAATPKYKDEMSSETWEDERNIRERVTQVSSDQQSWKEVDRSQEVVEKKITSQGGDTYTVTTITRKTLGEPDGEMTMQGGKANVKSIKSGGNIEVTKITSSGSSSGGGSGSGSGSGMVDYLEVYEQLPQLHKAQVGQEVADKWWKKSQWLLLMKAELDLLGRSGGSSSMMMQGGSGGSIGSSVMISSSSSGVSGMTSSSGQSGSDLSLSGQSSTSTSSDTNEEEEVTESLEIRTYRTSEFSPGGMSYYEQYISSGDGGDGGVTIINSHAVDSTDGNNKSLKSCMKKSRSDTQIKRGITFAENVVGGYTSSSAGDDSSEDGESDSESTTSYEEGSYDGREGSIVYQCKDDEAIAQGIPGAKMFDQNIRETFEMSKEMLTSSSVLAKYLEDSTEVQTKELNASLSVIQKEWFGISSQKLSEPHQVEDYLSSFNEISRRLLEYIVNMQDSNGNTAIHYAVSHCNFEIVNLLLDTGKVDLDKQNKAGYTPTMLATLAYPQTERQQEVVHRLFTMGNINARASKDGQTALMLAVSQGRTEMVKLLLQNGANVNAQDNEGSTAMMVGCEHGYTEIVKLLMAQADYDPSLADNDGSTPLSISMEAGHKDIGVLLYAQLNFKRQAQASPGLTRSRKTSHNTSPLASPSSVR
ncbi:LOW QUALITY PROTEIN: KN motif and ankyrin repeat domain-containing protein 1-like [Pecten maximus]|uniref:LOW QUALITY PROTEIN: KN motif and ankyrin repeat domain-containing protein 1-like n=1 Tax=Pecten maximus TaxID=6579 RepID=UPI001458A83F|nr:LOW QUALITY PROTEIN: KN motif and ankyrin repeat domain-containing protein 1-like [Pecten maximus]